MSTPRQSYSEYERKWLRINFQRNQPQQILQEGFAKKFKGKRISQATVSQSLGDDWAHLDRFALEELSKTKFRRPKEPRKRKSKQRARSVDLKDTNRKSSSHIPQSPQGPICVRRPSTSTSSWAAYPVSTSSSQPTEYQSQTWSSSPPPPCPVSNGLCEMSWIAQSTHDLQSLSLASPTTPPSQSSNHGVWPESYDNFIDATFAGYFVQAPAAHMYFVPNGTPQDRGPLRDLTNNTSSNRKH